MTDILNELIQIYDDLKTTCYYVTSEHVPDYVINDDGEKNLGFYGLEESSTGLDHLLVVFHPNHVQAAFEDTKHRINWIKPAQEDWIRANKKKLDNTFFQWILK
jgi:hypothetical protein